MGTNGREAGRSKPRREQCGRRWVVLTIAEPFPVLYGHANLTPEQKASGPHYQAGSRWYECLADDVKGPAFSEWRAEQLRTYGFTVTLTEEER